MAVTRRRYGTNGESYCAACKAEHYAQYRKDHPERVRHYTRKNNLNRRYGVEPSYVDGKPCDICGKEWQDGRRFHVDHDHATGKVRGVLCASCNTRLSDLGDDAEAWETLSRSKSGGGVSL
jgi:hypothetical protein